MSGAATRPEDLVAANPLDLKYYWRVIRRRKWTIIATFAVIFGAVVAYTLRQPRVYEGTAAVIIDVTAPKFLDQQVQDVTDNTSTNYWLNREYYETQNQIITSRTVSQRVVDKLGLQKDLSFLGIQSVKDGATAEKIAEGVDATAVLMSRIKVKPVKDSRLVNITVADSDPKRAALLANEVADAYMSENLALKLKITDSATRWLDERRESLETKSHASELAIYNFKKSTDMLTTSLEDRQSMVSQRLVALNTALTEVRTKIAGLSATVQTIHSLQKEAGAGDPRWAGALPAAIENELIKQLKLQLSTQSAECNEMAERYLDDHPKMEACRTKRREIEKNLLGELDTIVKSAEIQLREATAREKNLSNLFDAAKADAFEVNKKQIEFDQLKREADNDQRLYDLVLKRLKDIELSGLLRTSNVRVLDAARPNLQPVSPNVKASFLFALVAGILAGLGLAVMLELLDNSVTTQADVEDRLGLAFLGFVPTIVPEKGATYSGPFDLHIHRFPKSTVAECCRAVRTNLLFMSPDKPFKTMLVTSSGPQEGKSTTVINLGITVAQSGSRVLLIDTDMRRPRLHKAFGVPNDVGVSSLIVGEGSLDTAIKSTEVPNLFVMPCGPIPPNPAELLHTKAFADLLDKLCSKFDRVILDSPPIGPVADAVVLSTRADGVAIVVKGGKTNREAAKRAVRALRDVNARLFGAVLNNVDLTDSKYGDYYYSYRQYGYYYGEKKEDAA